MIVASGTGATGWALSISRATGVSVDLRPDDAAAVFLVREPWPSLASGVSIASGRLARGDTLLLVSRMNEGGVVFADGMEGDRLDFAWGRTLRVSIADRQLRFVPSRTPAASVRPAPIKAAAPTRPVPAKAASVRTAPRAGRSGALAAAKLAAAPKRALPPAASRRRAARLTMAVAILALIALSLLARACGGPVPPYSATDQSPSDSP